MVKKSEKHIGNSQVYQLFESEGEDYEGYLVLLKII